jgi:hypothetical protein
MSTIWPTYSAWQQNSRRTGRPLSLLQMLGITADTVGNIGGSFTPPPSAPSGISMSLNKRLSSDSTRKLLDWSPQRADIWDDVAFGSYVDP